MTYTSPTEINMSRGLTELLYYVNDVTNSWISNLSMVGIFIIILMGYYKAKDDFAGAFAIAGFGSCVAGLLFWIGGFVSGWAFSVSVGIALIGVIIILIDTQE